MCFGLHGATAAAFDCACVGLVAKVITSVTTPGITGPCVSGLAFTFSLAFSLAFTFTLTFTLAFSLAFSRFNHGGR